MATKRRAHGAAGCSGPTPTDPFTFALQVGALDRASVRAHVCALSYAALYVRRPRRVGGRCFAFEEAFMKSITIRNLCLLNAPPSSRGLIFPRAAAKKEPRYNKKTLHRIINNRILVRGRAGRAGTGSRSCRSCRSCVLRSFFIKAMHLTTREIKH